MPLFNLVLILSAPAYVLPAPEILHFAPVPAIAAYVIDSDLSATDCPSLAVEMRAAGLPVVCEVESF